MTQTAPAAEGWDARLRACVHCGLCLSSCPTYVVTGDEVESPRGRLLVMADVLEGHDVPPRQSLDRCLGCRNCETVCPSGVAYGSLLEASRERLGPPADPAAGLLTWMVDHVFASPRRLAVAGWLARMSRRVGMHRWMPSSWRGLLEGLPARAPSWPRTAALSRPGDVALLAGCAQLVYTPEVLPATATLVRAAGATPFVPAGVGCCGALSLHQGSVETARRRVQDLLQRVPPSVTLVVPSAGCSSHLRQLDALFEGRPEAESARSLASRTVDLVSWLAARADRLSFERDPRTVVYHPPCHHRHAQGIVEEPFRLLARVPELVVRRIEDEERCCGSAGSYSLAQPDLAGAIRAAKLQALIEAGCDLVLTANPGCELYLDQGLRSLPRAPAIEHLASYLAARLAGGPGLAGGGRLA